MSQPQPQNSDVLTELREWTMSNFIPTNKILQIYSQKGGWEGWAQVELALHFTALGDWNCERERQVYAGNAKRADLLLTSQGGQLDTTIVELKTEALWRDDTGPDNFVQSMRQDLVKIRDNQIKPELLPARLIVFGCTFVEDVNVYAANPENWGDFKTLVSGKKLIGSPNNYVGLYSWSVDVTVVGSGEIHFETG